MKTKMSIGRCCCQPDVWVPNTHLLALWVFKTEIGGVQQEPDPIEQFAISYIPFTPTNGMQYREAFTPPIEEQWGFGISSPGIPSASSARLRCDTYDLFGTPYVEYATTTVKAYYSFSPWNSTTIARTALKGGITMSWNWPYGTVNHEVNLTPILAAMQADPIYVPGLDFHWIMEPQDYAGTEPDMWGQSVDPFPGTVLETLP